jgi:LytS/YehU family sensor histidine kinase
MQALRGQLDPHFLFNSLHSITALVRESPTRAEEALLQFAALLRRVLEVKRDSTDEILLEDELRFVDDYLAIERLRLDERLRVERDISEEARHCWLPAFSVQPLVENAIGHAIAPRRDGGTITLRAHVRDGRLLVEVADNGPGADSAQLAGATGVGLSVIRQRLALRHGTDATLTIDTAPGRGFRVTLALPVQAAPLVEARA